MKCGEARMLPSSSEQSAFNDWVNERDKKVVDKFMKTYTPEEIYRKQLDEQNDIYLKAEKKKINDDQTFAARSTLVFLKSSLFCLMIPVAHLLPAPYNMTQLLIVCYVFWLNYPSFKRLNKMMKELKEKQKEAKETTDHTNYDPAV